MQKIIIGFLFLIINLSIAANNGSYQHSDAETSTLIPIKNNALSMESEKIVITIVDEKEITFETEVEYDYKSFYKAINEDLESYLSDLHTKQKEDPLYAEEEYRKLVEYLRGEAEKLNRQFFPSVKKDNNGSAIIENKITREKLKEERLIVSFDCTSVFKNTTNTAQEVLMGFPIEYECNSEEYMYSIMRESTHMYSYYKDTIQDFKTFIEDKEIAVKRYEHGKNPDNESIDYDAVYAFTVPFLPGESKQIRNTYTLFLTKDPYMFSYTIHYILKTGLTWKDNIKKADLILNIPKPFSPDTVGYDLWGKPKDNWDFDFFPRKIEKHYNDFTLQGDFYFCLYGLLKKNRDIKPLDEMIKAFNVYLNKRKDKEAVKFLENIKKGIYPEQGGDIIRNVYYWAGNYLFRTDIKKALEYYFNALLYARSNLNSYTSNKRYADYAEYISDQDLEHWVIEENAPCYYITCNMACAFSVMKDYAQALQWLEIALRLNRSLVKTVSSDKDLKNLRENENGKFSALMAKYGNK